MTSTLTRIRLPRGERALLLEWGTRTHEDMVALLRRHYENLAAEAREVLAIADEDFEVDVVRGLVVQHHVRKVYPRGRA